MAQNRRHADILDRFNEHCRTSLSLEERRNILKTLQVFLLCLNFRRTLSLSKTGIFRLNSIRSRPKRVQINGRVLANSEQDKRVENWNSRRPKPSSAQAIRYKSRNTRKLRRNGAGNDQHGEEVGNGQHGDDGNEIQGGGIGQNVVNGGQHNGEGNNGQNGEENLNDMNGAQNIGEGNLNNMDGEHGDGEENVNDEVEVQYDGDDDMDEEERDGDNRERQPNVPVQQLDEGDANEQNPQRIPREGNLNNLDGEQNDREENTNDVDGEQRDGEKNVNNMDEGQNDGDDDTDEEEADGDNRERQPNRHVEQFQQGDENEVGQQRRPRRHLRRQKLKRKAAANVAELQQQLGAAKRRFFSEDESLKRGAIGLTIGCKMLQELPFETNPFSKERILEFVEQEWGDFFDASTIPLQVFAKSDVPAFFDTFQSCFDVFHEDSPDMLWLLAKKHMRLIAEVTRLQEQLKELT